MKPKRPGVRGLTQIVLALAALTLTLALAAPVRRLLGGPPRRGRPCHRASGTPSCRP
jgi:hypothetical protein